MTSADEQNKDGRCKQEVDKLALTILSQEVRAPCSVCNHNAAYSWHIDHWIPGTQSVDSQLFAVKTLGTLIRPGGY